MYWYLKWYLNIVEKYIFVMLDMRFEDICVYFIYVGIYSIYVILFEKVDNLLSIFGY